VRGRGRYDLGVGNMSGYSFLLAYRGVLDLVHWVAVWLVHAVDTLLVHGVELGFLGYSSLK
jgi:hypothetical protein